MILEIDGIFVEVTKKPIKNIILRIYPPDGLVKLSTPLRYSNRLIKNHLQEKSLWIREQREKIRSQHVVQENRIETGASIPFQGKNYLLVVEEYQGRPKIIINDELCFFYTPLNTSMQEREHILEEWYRKEMNKLLPSLTAHWEKIIAVKVAQYSIRKMKTRWGSCNTRAHRISLNLNLIKKPLNCLEYVLVHELVHSLEASHNHRFYSFMDQFMPQWRHYYYLLEGKMPKK